MFEHRCHDILYKLWEIFKENFMEISNKHAPIKSHTVEPGN